MVTEQKAKQVARAGTANAGRREPEVGTGTGTCRPVPRIHLCLLTTSMSVEPPAHSDAVKVAFPAEHVLLLSMNRPKSLNAMSFDMEQDLRTLMDWFDEEPSLWFDSLSLLF